MECYTGKTIFTAFINAKSLSVTMTPGSASRLKKYLKTVIDLKQQCLDILPPNRQKQLKILVSHQQCQVTTTYTCLFSKYYL